MLDEYQRGPNQCTECARDVRKIAQEMRNLLEKEDRNKRCRIFIYTMYPILCDPTILYTTCILLGPKPKLESNNVGEVHVIVPAWL